jgi:hypothetical protein
MILGLKDYHDVCVFKTQPQKLKVFYPRCVDAPLLEGVRGWVRTIRK